MPGAAPDRRDAAAVDPRRASSPSAWACRRSHVLPSTTPSSSAAARPASRPPFTARPRDCAPWWSSARRPEARPGRPRASRTISASPAASRATSSRAAHCSRQGGSGAEILVTRSVARIDPATRAGSTSMATISSAARTIILATGVTWRRLAIDGFDRLIGKGIYYGAARSEASATHGLDVHLIGAGNSAGQAALYLRQSRAHGDARGARRFAGKEHVPLPDRAARDEVERDGATALGSRRRARRHASDGDRHPRWRERQTVRRHDCGGLFVFIGADAETGWLPADIARDDRGYVLTGDDVVKAGRWSHQPRSLPPRIECARCLRLRRRAAEPGEARCLRGR